MVSKKKKRYKGHGFNLDLAYITDRIIAMGYPSSGKEACYRNPRAQVRKFLDHFHPGQVKLYNLCSEREYDVDYFYGRVGRFPFPDHNPPQLQMMDKFCEDLHAFLQKDSNNVSAVHCKAGKGRTGVMICAYLVYSRVFFTGEEAMQFYGRQRTKDGKGVTIPSQRRFVNYYASILNSTMPPVKQLLPKRISIKLPGKAAKTDFAIALCTRRQSAPSESKDLEIEIHTDCGANPTCFFHKDRTYAQGVAIQVTKDEVTVDFQAQDALPLFEWDMQIAVYDSTIHKKAHLFSAWLNTAFLGQSNKVRFERKDLDKVDKSLSKKLEFTVQFREHKSELPSPAREPLSRKMQLVQAAKKTVAANRLASPARAGASGGQEVEPEVDGDDEADETVAAGAGDLEELRRRLDAQEQGTGEMSEAFSTMKAELLSTREELLECRALLGDVESMEKISSLVEDRNALKELVEKERRDTKEVAEKNRVLEEESSALRADISKLREQVKAMEFQLGQRQGDAGAPDGRDETISMLKDSVAKMHHLLKTLQIEPPDLGVVGAEPGPSSPGGGSGGDSQRAASRQEERAVAAAATAAVSNITSVAAAKRKARSRVRR